MTKMGNQRLIQWHPVRCHRCEQPLKPENEVWLELHMRTGVYSDPKKVAIAPDDSQGLFVFGAQCARVLLANQ